MIVDRIGFALLVLGAGGIACMMLPDADEPDPFAAPDVAPQPSACASHTYEPDHGRMPDWMLGAEDRTIVEGSLAIEWMRGPFLTLGHACGTWVAKLAILGPPPFQASIVSSDEQVLAVQVGGLWYARSLGDSAGFESAVQRLDIAPTGGGSELVIAMTREHPYRETRLICGVGPSGVPSCAQIELGDEGTSPGWGTHLRLDTSCDGTAMLVGWRTRHVRCGDDIRMWIRERVKLAFP